MYKKFRIESKCRKAYALLKKQSMKQPHIMEFHRIIMEKFSCQLWKLLIMQFYMETSSSPEKIVDIEILIIIDELID